MSTYLFTKPVPLRNKPSGTKTLANAGTDIYLGLDALQKRYRFIISNRDAAKTIEVADSSGRVYLPIFPQTTIGIVSDQDLSVVNNSGAGVSYNVLEEFFDESASGVVGGTHGTQTGLRGTGVDNFNRSPAPTSGGTLGRLA